MDDLTTHHVDPPPGPTHWAYSAMAFAASIAILYAWLEAIYYLTTGG